MGEAMTFTRNGLDNTLGRGAGLPERARRRKAAQPLRRQDGTFAVICAASLVTMLAVSALALDIGQLYNRKAELHGIAKAAALAAARELNGTAGGVSAALAKAKQTAEALKYQYKLSVSWSDTAISFASSPAPASGWVDATTASGAPQGLSFVKVDTGGLDAATGTVSTAIMQLLAHSLTTVQLNDRAVAGRSAINVTPLAICAMSQVPGEARTNPGNGTASIPATVELIQYGFRRGVSYNLMELNPDGVEAKNYLVDPLLGPGATGASSGATATVAGPFVCTGTMWMSRVTGGTIHVSFPFPLGSLYSQLNARFDQFGDSVCSPNGAPPDYNIKQFKYPQLNGAPWMRPTTGLVSAAIATSRGRRETVADLPSPPPSTPAGNFGPLWTYAKAVKFSSYVDGSPEPVGGYTPFGTGDWPSLYYLGAGSSPASPR